jgi:hypothetical protein
VDEHAGFGLQAQTDTAPVGLGEHRADALGEPLPQLGRRDAQGWCAAPAGHRLGSQLGPDTDRPDQVVGSARRQLRMVQQRRMVLTTRIEYVPGTRLHHDG